MKTLKLVARLGVILCIVAIPADYDPATGTVSAQSQQAEQKVGANVGEQAPDFQLQQMDGRTVSLSDLRGHPLVLIFWTGWCSICRTEAPDFNRLAQRYQVKGVRLLGINIQDSEKRTRVGIRDLSIRYSVARDPDASVARLYQVTATPTVIFLNRRGIVSYRGNRLPRDYDRHLEGLIRERGHQSQIE